MSEANPGGRRATTLNLEFQPLMVLSNSYGLDSKRLFFEGVSS
jgi:hypothetical protein